MLKLVLHGRISSRNFGHASQFHSIVAKNPKPKNLPPIASGNIVIGIKDRQCAVIVVNVSFICMLKTCKMFHFTFLAWVAILCLFQTDILFTKADTCGSIKRQPFPSLQITNQVTTCFREFIKYQRIPKQSDYGLRTDQVIRNHGYNLVTYNNVTSSDGYIQTMFRITGSPKSPPRSGKQSVMLVHGLGVASASWVLLGNQSIAFVLADAGYEVWLPNLRGTDYSDRHITLNAYKDFKYWDFTYTEMALYDVPVYINLILKTTGREKLFAVTHSLGASIITAALAEKPELNDKIYANFMFGATQIIKELTPVTYRGSSTAIVPPEFWDFLFDNFVLGYYPVGNLIATQNSKVCMSSAPGCGFCAILLSLSGLSKPDYSTLDHFSIASRAFSQLPAKTYNHLSQNARTCRFQKYDYGPTKNLRLYGQKFPPSYNLRNVKSHIYIYYGDGDTYTSVKGQQEFFNSLPSEAAKAFRRIQYKGFVHNDYVTNKNAMKVVYLPIINDMKQYE